MDATAEDHMTIPSPRSGQLSGPPDDALPIGPLVKMIEQRGGLPVLFPHETFEALDGSVRHKVTPEANREFLRIKQIVNRAKASGFLSFYLADEICINVLGVHPAQVWRSGWMDAAAALTRKAM